MYAVTNLSDKELNLIVLDIIGGSLQEFVVDSDDGIIMEVFQHGQQFIMRFSLIISVGSTCCFIFIVLWVLVTVGVSLVGWLNGFAFMVPDGYITHASSPRLSCSCIVQ